MFKCQTILDLALYDSFLRTTRCEAYWQGSSLLGCLKKVISTTEVIQLELTDLFLSVFTIYVPSLLSSPKNMAPVDTISKNKIPNDVQKKDSVVIWCFNLDLRAKCKKDLENRY